MHTIAARAGTHTYDTHTHTSFSFRYSIMSSRLPFSSYNLPSMSTFMCKESNYGTTYSVTDITNVLCTSSQVLWCIVVPH